MSGRMTLEGEGADPRPLAAGDAFAIPPGLPNRYADPSADLELLEVALPGRFRTLA
jgi:quercetin dioxygenase-like cupin family protein